MYVLYIFLFTGAVSGDIVVPQSIAVSSQLYGSQAACLKAQQAFVHTFTLDPVGKFSYCVAYDSNR